MGVEELVGLTLAGRYEVLELLGAGGMGTVYRAHDRELDEVVALKGIHPELAANPHMVERFRREVKLARKVTHRNVARTFELVHTDHLVFCTMELIAGESLKARLQRERLSVEHAAWIAAQVCEALAAAHAVGVVHRDIKPDNILLACDGRVVVADFGVAAVTATDAGEVSGTPSYMAPEQARGEPVTPAADIYSLGIVVLEMLSGHRPSLGALSADDLDADLAQLIALMTAPDPAHRIALSQLSARLAPRAAAPSAHHAPEPAVLLHDLIIVAPTGDQQLHLAHGIYTELLPKLALEPRLRVLPRATSLEPTPNCSVVELAAGSSLTATIRTSTHARTVAIPLDVGQLSSAAEMLAAAIVGELHRTPLDANKAEVTDLLLRAEIASRGGLVAYPEALALVSRARVLLPDDPMVVAAHALAVVREAMITSMADRLDRARVVVEAALVKAPHRAESHVAAGHVAIQTGNAPSAAAHYRTAIARSRYLPDGHDGLGRLLLEAGFLDQGFARIDDALAIAPTLWAARWEIARAYALEQRWADYQRMLVELASIDRPLIRWRVALYTRDVPAISTLVGRLREYRGFEPELTSILADSSVDARSTWDRHRDRAIEIVETVPCVQRRRSSLCQLAAEVAAFVGDDDAAIRLIGIASAHGLIDRHWLERCPLLERVRDRSELARARAQVARRADLVLDALYGDVEPETVVD